MPAFLMRPTSWPFTITRPEVGRSMAATIFIKVDLPAPDGPARYTSSPFAMFSDTSASASVLAESVYFLETDWNSIIARVIPAAPRRIRRR